MSSPSGTHQPSPPSFPTYSPSPSPPPLQQQQQEPPSPNSTIPSLPSSPTISTAASSSSSSQDSDSDGINHAHSDAEREWRESLQQMELLLTMVAVPYLGKYFGRRCAYWGGGGQKTAWARFMTYKYPDLEIAVTSKAAFKGAGAVEAAASL